MESGTCPTNIAALFIIAIANLILLNMHMITTIDIPRMAQMMYANINRFLPVFLLMSLESVSAVLSA